MADTDPLYNADEVHVLRLARHFRDMVSTEWWREYKKILEVQIADRERLLVTPIGAKHPAFDGLDFQTRVVQMETIKGAIIGLRLALSIPADTISHATTIRADHSPTENLDAS